MLLRFSCRSPRALADLIFLRVFALLASPILRISLAILSSVELFVEGDGGRGLSKAGPLLLPLLVAGGRSVEPKLIPESTFLPLWPLL